MKSKFIINLFYKKLILKEDKKRLYSKLLLKN